MKAMVLCAGLGTRLRPVTTVWPKPAIPLLGQPLLRYSLATLRAAGVTEVGINTHHLPQVMSAVAQAETKRYGMSLTVVHEAGEIQGTGGGIRGLREGLRDADFVVMNGDVLFAFDVRPAIEAHRASKAAATMVLLPMPANEKYNPVEVDAHGHVRRIAGVGPGGERLTPWHFSGVHVMTPSVFDFMSAAGPEDINRDVYVRMINAGLNVRGFTLNEPGTYWSDLGTPRRYGATHQDVLFHQVPMAAFGDASPFLKPSRALGSARVSGPAWFSSDASCGADVRIGAGVSVGCGASLGDRVSLNRVAVLDGAHVPTDTHLEDCLVAPPFIVVPYEAAFGSERTR